MAFSPGADLPLMWFVNVETEAQVPAVTIRWLMRLGEFERVSSNTHWPIARAMGDQARGRLDASRRALLFTAFR
jgi:hypothetical protein